MELARENVLEWYDEAAFSQVAVTTPGAGLAAFTVHVLAHAQEHAGRGGGGSGARAYRLLRRNSLDSHHGLQIHRTRSSHTSIAPSPTPHSRAPPATSLGIQDSPSLASLYCPSCAPMPTIPLRPSSLPTHCKKGTPVSTRISSSLFPFDSGSAGAGTPCTAARPGQAGRDRCWFV